ncbi:hypothetical protein ONZ51_g12475 [Trametes cubensis]|uniref:Uncharacterized protein n=1 Tax=Trametes cubensis TaxID=1111947 RepID=A0AAD7TFP1_9APHY|nr:hypothetical protein ONZ51_g12475 [Trametes cubensis]
MRDIFLLGPQHTTKPTMQNARPLLQSSIGRQPIESKPPYKGDEREACENSSVGTYNVVVGAADCIGRARVARTNTNYVDGRAVEPDEPSDVPEDDAEEPEQDVRRSGVRLQETALNGAGAAALASLELNGGGGRKERESEGGESSDATGEHCYLGFYRSEAGPYPLCRPLGTACAYRAKLFSLDSHAAKGAVTRNGGMMLRNQ